MTVPNVARSRRPTSVARSTKRVTSITPVPAKWQVIEEHVGASSNPERQFVWGLRYVDDIVERDGDTNGNGTLDERMYGLQDGNWSVTATVPSTGTVYERYWYSAYGRLITLTASFGDQAASAIAWDVTFCGYRDDGNVCLVYARSRFYHPDMGV